MPWTDKMTRGAHPYAPVTNRLYPENLWIPIKMRQILGINFHSITNNYFYYGTTAKMDIHKLSLVDKSICNFQVLNLVKNGF